MSEVEKCIIKAAICGERQATLHRTHPKSNLRAAYRVLIGTRATDDPSVGCGAAGFRWVEDPPHMKVNTDNYDEAEAAYEEGLPWVRGGQLDDRLDAGDWRAPQALQA